MKQEDVFMIVSVKDKLPPKHAMYNCSTGRRDLFEKLEFIDDHDEEPGFYDTHGNRVDVYYWLEKKTNLITCTKEDLVKVFYAGQDKGHVMEKGFGNSTTPTCQEYLESLGIKL
jgi:hypothetical protein